MNSDSITIHVYARDIGIVNVDMHETQLNICKSVKTTILFLQQYNS